MYTALLSDFHLKTHSDSMIINLRNILTKEYNFGYRGLAVPCVEAVPI